MNLAVNNCVIGVNRDISTPTMVGYKVRVNTPNGYKRLKGYDGQRTFKDRREDDTPKLRNNR